LSDEIKESATQMVSLLHKQKVEVVLLTGDHEENAKDISNKLGIDRYHSELLPEQKSEILEQEINGSKKGVAFIGDGINDAPSIIRSDIGIAMGGIGSDIAVENADVVIMNDNPVKVYESVKIARIARHTAIFNIIFALAIKAIVAILVLIFGNAIPMAIPVIADTGLTVVLVINSLLILYRKISRK
jgi:Cd2+/Zn2+-exporting ATPase